MTQSRGQAQLKQARDAAAALRPGAVERLRALLTTLRSESVPTDDTKATATNRTSPEIAGHKGRTTSTGRAAQGEERMTTITATDAERDITAAAAGLEESRAALAAARIEIYQLDRLAKDGDPGLQWARDRRRAELTTRMAEIEGEIVERASELERRHGRAGRVAEMEAARASARDAIADAVAAYDVLERVLPRLQAAAQTELDASQALARLDGEAGAFLGRQHCAIPDVGPVFVQRSLSQINDARRTFTSGRL